MCVCEGGAGGVVVVVVCVCVCEGGGGGGVSENVGRECAAGTLNAPPIHIISRLTKHTYSYNLHVKRYYSLLQTEKKQMLKVLRSSDVH